MAARWVVRGTGSRAQHSGVSSPLHQLTSSVTSGKPLTTSEPL